MKLSKPTENKIWGACSSSSYYYYYYWPFWNPIFWISIWEKRIESLGSKSVQSIGKLLVWLCYSRFCCFCLFVFYLFIYLFLLLLLFYFNLNSLWNKPTFNFISFIRLNLSGTHKYLSPLYMFFFSVFKIHDIKCWNLVLKARFHLKFC